jgi:hypothetical protein
MDPQAVAQMIARANPGAPPQVIAAAVQQYLKMGGSNLALREQQLQLGYDRLMSSDYWKGVGAGQKQEGLDISADKLVQSVNTQRVKMGLNPLTPDQILGGGMGGLGRGGGAQQAQPQEQQAPDKPQGDQQLGGNRPPANLAEKIADDMYNHRRPPLIGGYGGYGAPKEMQPAIEKALADRHPDYNRAQDVLKWQAELKLAQAMNGPQQLRFVQLGNSLQPALSRMQELSRQMQLGGLTILNEADLYKQAQDTSTPRGQLAAKYITEFNGIRGELAQYENGGYAPTDASWKTAYEQLQVSRGVKAQLAALDEVKRIISFRKQGMESVAPGLSPGSPNPYQPSGGGGGGTVSDRFQGFSATPAGQ